MVLTVEADAARGLRALRVDRPGRGVRVCCSAIAETGKSLASLPPSGWAASAAANVPPGVPEPIEYDPRGSESDDDRGEAADRLRTCSGSTARACAILIVVERRYCRCACSQGGCG